MQMDLEASICNPLDLQRMLHDERAKPRYLRISLLESITNNFSHDLQIGCGGFAVVYKGQLENGEVAVKKLTQTLDVDDLKFQQEVDTLMSVEHKNIVRFLGYCSDTQGKMVKQNQKKNVMAEERQRFLCFEYLPWTLDKYIKDPPGEHEWRTFYWIIKGIGNGLHYLHQQNIVHLDLKPANILLDHYMVPQISDFGLSKRFDENQTRTITLNLFGTLGYMAPELYSGQITLKSDIYSLGIIIIEILTGNKGCPDIDSVVENWRIKMGMSPEDVQLNLVRVCAEIGIECTDYNPEKRPDTGCILERLDEMESTYGVMESYLGTSLETNDKMPSMDVAAAPYQSQEIRRLFDRLVDISTDASSSVSTAPSRLQRIIGVLHGPEVTSRKIQFDQSSEISMLLDVHPLELRFPWVRKKNIERPVTVTNRTDCYVGVWITPTCKDTSSKICFTFRDVGQFTPILHATMEPHSTIAIALEMKAEREPPPDEMFEVLMIVIESKLCLETLISSVGIKNMDNEFLKIVEKLGGEVHGVMLKAAVICDPASCCQKLIQNPKFVTTPSQYEFIRGLELHPTETWILVLGWWDSVFILNYETQKIEMMFLVINSEIKEILSILWRKTLKRLFSPTSTHYISSGKFIALEQWIVVGDTCGWVHVYSYTTKSKVTEFEAHQAEFLHDVVLAVHPTSPYLLTSCVADDSIKLWDWSKGWKCTKKFDIGLSKTSYVTWNPVDSDIFISISGDAIMVWNIHFSDAPTKLEGSYSDCCLCRYGHQDFMVASELCSNGIAHVWDMKTMQNVHKFFLRGEKIYDIACHPTLPILVTRFNNSIGVWDARTYRLAKMVDFIGVNVEGHGTHRR